jgi:NADP-dependent alcohol dehydrogenase
VIDGTKFVAAAIDYDGEPWDILETRGDTVTSALPFGSVLTLPATGSEMNDGSVVTRRATQAKLAFTSPHVFPRFSILDPTKTYTLPIRQIANGVVDSFTHVMEQYLTYPADGLVQDRFAEGLLQTLIEIGPKLLEKADDYELRAFHVGRDARAQRADRRRRAAGLVDAHHRSRTDRALQYRPRTHAGRRPSRQPSGS